MLTITKQPTLNAAGGGEAEYRIETDRKETLNVKVTDAETNALLGTKRYAEVTEATVDAAPIVNRHLHFAPETGPTGFLPAKDRRHEVKVKVETADATATSGTCVYHAGEKALTASGLLTTMPLQRLIAPGECDEVTMLTIDTPWMTVRAAGPGGTKERNYSTRNTVVQVFRLNTADFPGAERITLTTGEGQTVEYTVIASPKGARRIAWRSRAGSLEHYTFPTEAVSVAETKKTRVRNAQGTGTLTEERRRRTLLRSAYETREVLEALAEIIAAPQVWLAEADGYVPVEVLTNEATVHRHGTMSLLELEIGTELWKRN
jgi:hypothetical protein